MDPAIKSRDDAKGGIKSRDEAVWGRSMSRDEAKGGIKSRDDAVWGQSMSRDGASGHTINPQNDILYKASYDNGVLLGAGFAS